MSGRGRQCTSANGGDWDWNGERLRVRSVLVWAETSRLGLRRSS